MDLACIDRETSKVLAGGVLTRAGNVGGQGEGLLAVVTSAELIEHEAVAVLPAPSSDYFFLSNRLVSSGVRAELLTAISKTGLSSGFVAQLAACPPGPATCPNPHPL